MNEEVNRPLYSIRRRTGQLVARKTTPNPRLSVAEPEGDARDWPPLHEKISISVGIV